MKVKVGECKICGAPIVAESPNDTIVPEFTCGHFAMTITYQQNW